MTHRERVLTACRCGKPDRVPRQIWRLPEVTARLKEYLGDRDLDAWLNEDLRGMGWGPTRLTTDFQPYFDRPMEWDEWGRGRVWDAERHYAEYFYPLRHATTVEEIHAYPWPDLDQPYRYEHVGDWPAACQREGWPVIVGLAETVFEIAWQLRSMDELFEDFAFRPELAEALLDHITDMRVYAARRFAESGVDVVEVGDDVAMQTGLMMSRKTWRQWFGPRLKRVIDAAKAAKPDVVIKYHSDGNVTDLIPDLMEAGVEALNPVQPECMDHGWVKKTYGDRLAFWGGLGVQSVLPFGTPDQVRVHVREVIQTLGAGGGLIVGPSHVLETDTPMENVAAMVEAIDEFGAY